jgi:hypothetical protein
MIELRWILSDDGLRNDLQMRQRISEGVKTISDGSLSESWRWTDWQIVPSISFNDAVPYGQCSQCQKPVIDLLDDGNAKCSDGHIFPFSQAIFPNGTGRPRYHTIEHPITKQRLVIVDGPAQ